MSDAGFQPRATNLTDRARLYLRCIEDWKAPYEIAALLGDKPPPTVSEVKRMLGRLAARGFVYHSRANDTYRVTIAGRNAVGTPATTKD
jgi:DNA-binding IclR family transcriptional regulator